MYFYIRRRNDSSESKNLKMLISLIVEKYTATFWIDFLFWLNSPKIIIIYRCDLIIVFLFGIWYAQFLGKWYEVERTFYLPEIASSCTTLSFDYDSEGADSESTLDISIDSINQWTGSPSQNVGHATRESESTSIMDFQVFKLLWIENVKMET